jgi:hypothetical protein
VLSPLERAIKINARTILHHALFSFQYLNILKYIYCCMLPLALWSVSDYPSKLGTTEIIFRKALMLQYFDFRFCLSMSLSILIFVLQIGLIFGGSTAHCWEMLTVIHEPRKNLRLADLYLFAGSDGFMYLNYSLPYMHSIAHSWGILLETCFSFQT